MVEELGANPQGATETLSFRDRMKERLAAERTSGEPAPRDDYVEVQANPSEESSDTAGEGYEESPDSARQADGEVEAELDESTADAEPEEAIAQTSDDDANTDDGVPADVRELAERADKAEERARMMERDYRIKTHKIAAATRDLEDTQEIVRKQAAFMLNLAEQGVKQFEGLNWQQLQTTPEQYQQAKQAFDTACQQRDLLQKNLGGIADNHRQLLETAKSREAEVSKDILKTTIDGWSNELYGKLRDHAIKELSYTESEFDEITDWRRIRDIHAQYQISKTNDEVMTLRRKKAKQPVKRQRERPTGQPRNAQGQFQNARQALFNNPGDRGARRSFFMEKLKAERGR